MRGVFVRVTFSPWVPPHRRRPQGPQPQQGGRSKQI